MIYTDEQMERALRRLPSAVLEALAVGPRPEPGCRVCFVLLPIYDNPHQHHTQIRAARTLLMYHDEATYDPDQRLDHDTDPWGDYLWATGLGCVNTYMRCQRIYERARGMV